MADVPVAATAKCLQGHHVAAIVKPKKKPQQNGPRAASGMEIRPEPQPRSFGSVLESKFGNYL